MYIMEVKFRTSDTICDKNSSYKFCGQSCSLTIKKNKSLLVIFGPPSIVILCSRYVKKSLFELLCIHSNTLGKKVDSHFVELLSAILGLGGKTLGLIMILVSFVGFGLYRFSGLSHLTIWFYCFFLYFWLRISPSLFVLNLS